LSTVAIPHDVEPHPLTGMFNGKFGIWLFLASEVMLFGALFSTYVVLRVGAPEGTWPKHGSEILSVPLAMFNTAVLITSSVTMVMAWASLKMNQPSRGQLYLTLTFLLAGTFLVVKYFEYKDKFTHYQVELKAPIPLHGHEASRVTGHLAAGNPEFSVGGAPPEYLNIVPDPPAGEAGHGADGHGQELRIDGANIRRVTHFGPRHSTFLATYFTLTGLHGLHIVGGMVVILYFMITGASQVRWNPAKYANRIECTGLYWHFVDLVWIFLFPVLYLL
jgi:cytochrome c oxidase subunit 3